MKICFIGEGTSIHTQRWVNFFAEKGHEIHLISSHFPPDYLGYEPTIRFHQLSRLVPQIWKVSRYPSGIRWLFQVREYIKKIKPDVLDTHYITIHGYLGAISGFHPLILTAWGSDVLIVPKRYPIHRLLTRYSLKKADIAVCDSETVKKRLLALGAEPGKIRIIYNGIDTQQFNPGYRNQALREKLGAGKAAIVISIRHLTPTYNVEMLIRAIPIVLERAPETIFIIGGDGVQKAYLENVATALGVTDNTRFIGYVPHDELPQYLASSDIYVSTSISDSSSMSLQEAMACGLAPVVTDLPANREWVTDGENGFIVGQNNISALADKVVYLINNRNVRNSFGKAGQKLIQERAEYRVEMERVEKMYQELAGEL
jgi:glycosyltransferase involved in cell wall biosynthesis